MNVHPKLTLILTLGALAISAPAMAEPGAGWEGFGPSGSQQKGWNNNSDDDQDFGRRDRDGFGRFDRDGRDDGGFGKFDRDGRGPGPDFAPAFDRVAHLRLEARMKIRFGQSLIEQGKSLVRYGHRSHQWSFVRQGRELQHRGERLVRIGRALAREARMLAFR